MPILTEEQMQLKREALRSLEDNPTHQLLLDKLRAQQRNKRAEQREAAFSGKPDVAYGCEWALWGLEQTEKLLAEIKRETNDRTEKAIKY
jgi:hypothetical protein